MPINTGDHHYRGALNLPRKRWRTAPRLEFSVSILPPTAGGILQEASHIWAITALLIDAFQVDDTRDHDHRYPSEI